MHSFVYAGIKDTLYVILSASFHYFRATIFDLRVIPAIHKISKNLKMISVVRQPNKSNVI